MLLGAVLSPGAVVAAAPNVRVLDPAQVTINGQISDWGSPLGNSNPNYLADMFQAGKPTKPVLAKAFGRYDCGTGTMYIMVRAQPGWQIVPSPGDNYAAQTPPSSRRSSLSSASRCSTRRRPGTTG